MAGTAQRDRAERDAERRCYEIPHWAHGTSVFAAAQAVAPSLRPGVNPLNLRDAAEIERAVTAFGARPRRPRRAGERVFGGSIAT